LRFLGIDLNRTEYSVFIIKFPDSGSNYASFPLHQSINKQKIARYTYRAISVGAIGLEPTTSRM
jgi:hypothetical protein